MKNYGHQKTFLPLTSVENKSYSHAGRVFFQAEDGIRDVERSRGLGDVYKRQQNVFKIVGFTEQLSQISQMK